MKMLLNQLEILKVFKLALVNNLNVYDILKYDKFIITKEAVKKVEEVYA